MASTTTAADEKHLMNTYGPRSVTFVRGAGVRLYDADGREYLDFLSGLGVNNLGHCHPAIVAAIRRQSETLLHCCNLYLIEPQARLADTLCEHSIFDRAFFCNSGAEAVEAALKLCRLRAHGGEGAARTGFVAMESSFHGRTLGAMSVCGPARVRDGFEPALPNVRFARFNDLEHVREQTDETVCGVIVEPVIGEGGVMPATPEFLQGLRALCDERGIALVFDEIQCGLGRIGSDFAYQHFGVEPDVVTLAKGLAGGLPIGCVLARGEFADVLQPGKHGSTFGGNALCAATACAYCEELFGNGLAARARATGEYLRARLEQIAADNAAVTGVRGIGMMLALTLEGEGAGVVKRAQELGLLINCTAGSVIRLLPPLIATEAECDEAADILEQCLSEQKQ